MPDRRRPSAAGGRPAPGFVGAMRSALGLPAGSDELSFLLQEGVDVLIRVDADGRPTIACDHGPADALDRTHWQAYIQSVGQARHSGRVVVASGHLWLMWQGDSASSRASQVEDALDLLAAAAAASEAVRHALS